MNELLDQARERLRQARALPIGPARNDQRQIAVALKALAKLMTIAGARDQCHRSNLASLQRLD